MWAGFSRLVIRVQRTLVSIKVINFDQLSNYRFLSFWNHTHFYSWMQSSKNPCLSQTSDITKLRKTSRKKNAKSKLNKPKSQWVCVGSLAWVRLGQDCLHSGKVMHLHYTYNSSPYLADSMVCAHYRMNITLIQYRLDGSGIESRCGWDFPTCPKRPWVPPSLLYNVYRVLPGGKVDGAWCWPPSPIYSLG